jgi:cytochrome c peroxidase
MIARLAYVFLLSAAFTLGALVAVNRAWSSPWNAEQQAALRSFWIGSLGPPPADPTNRVAEDPRAARLGARLFREPRLSASGQISCATCHQPERAYTDGLTVARGLGEGPRGTPSVVGSAYSSTYFWDGRRDSQWAQALTPLEGSLEMGATRTQVASVVVRHYRKEYEAVFGPVPSIAAERLATGASPLGSPAAREAWTRLPQQDQEAVDRLFSNVGKAIAAYERALTFEPSRFDSYAAQVLRGNHLLASTLLSPDEVDGFALFIGRGRCSLCHRGPLFTGHEFFALGLPPGKSGQDPGRAKASKPVREDPFNCLGRFSDGKPADCSELRYWADDELAFYANFKTPSLRNVALTAPYMHAGHFAELAQVVEHYDRAPPVYFPEHTDIRPLGLSALERRQLVAFLGTLTSSVRDPYAFERPAN